MQMIADLHTHTLCATHAYNTFTEMAAAAKVLNAIDKITSNIEVVVTVSANAADLPEDLKKFVI